MRSATGRIRPAIVGCLVIAAIGVAAYVAIWLPGLLDAIERGKQKRTVAAMGRIGDELERYRRETGLGPSSAVLEELFQRSEGALHRTDEWGRPFQFEWGGDGYLIVSLGKDGAPDFDRNATGLIETTRFTSDIVWKSGKFVQLPVNIPPDWR